MAEDKDVRPFGVEFLEEMLSEDADVYGATSICVNQGPSYVHGSNPPIKADNPPPPVCNHD